MIANSNGNFLGKIIDEKISLPYQFNAADNWTKAIDNIYIHVAELTDEKFNEDAGVWVHDSNGRSKKLLMADIKKSFVDIAIAEERTLRDLVQFGKAVDQYYFETGKYEITNIRDQLILLYLYVFYPVVYDRLKVAPNVEDLLSILGVQPNSDDDKGQSSEIKLTLEERNILYKINGLLSQTYGYPDGFYKNPLGYFVFEDSSLLKNKQLNDLIQNDDEMNGLLDARNEMPNQTSAKQDQLSAYVVRKQRKDSNFIVSSNLLKKVITFASKGKVNNLSIVIAHEYSNAISNTREATHLSDDKKQVLSQKWVEKLKDAGIDSISKQIYILRILNVVSMWSDFPKEYQYELENINTATDEHANEQLYLYIFKHHFQNDALWDETIWNTVESLKPEAYLSFWADMHLMVMPHSTDSIESTNVHQGDLNWVLVTKNQPKTLTSVQEDSTNHRALAVLKIKRHIEKHLQDFEDFNIYEAEDKDSLKSMSKLNLDQLDTITTNVELIYNENSDWPSHTIFSVVIHAPKIEAPDSVKLYNYGEYDADDEYDQNNYLVDYNDIKDTTVLSTLASQYLLDYGSEVDFDALMSAEKNA